jgi:hypothetical protein
MYNRTILVRTGAMRSTNKIVRQSVSLPVNVAAQVRGLAKAHRLSSNRMLAELIENGFEAEKRKQQEFSNLPSFSATLPTQRKPSVSVINWAEWFLAADAQDRALGHIRQHLIDQMRDRAITIADLNQLRVWIESKPEVPEGEWYKDFGSFRICGHGSYPKTFLLRGKAAKGELL